MFGNEVEGMYSFRATIPEGIKSKSVLLEALYDALRFPDYFGSNWDALDECICDLSWLPAGRVALIHRDVPLPGNHDAQLIYLSILKDAHMQFSRGGTRDIDILFPESARCSIHRILDEVGSDDRNL